MLLQSAILNRVPHIIYGFGTGVEPVPAPVQSIWDRRVQWKQTHGTSIACVQRPTQQCGEVDALYTRESGIPVAVQTADCVPILLARRDGSVVGAVHAGWRGTRARILREAWIRLAREGERPSDWVAAIGPAIGPCCYEVDEELANAFQCEFASAGERVAVPTYRRLDLPAINAWELRDIGFHEVEILRACTYCSGSRGNPLFHSFRREKTAVRQWSVIAREAN